MLVTDGQQRGCCALFGYPDSVEHSSGVAKLGAMGEIAMFALGSSRAGGTLRYQGDLCLLEAGGQELMPVGLPEV
jgi:hypothetical protein